MLSPGEGGLYLAILILLAIAGIFTIGGGEDDFEDNFPQYSITINRPLRRYMDGLCADNPDDPWSFCSYDHCYGQVGLSTSNQGFHVLFWLVPLEVGCLRIATTVKISNQGWWL